MTKTLKLATAAAGFAMLIASPAYAFLGGVPGPNGAYTDQRTNSCCVSDGHKTDFAPITGKGPPKGKTKKNGGGNDGGGNRSSGGNSSRGGTNTSPIDSSGFGGGDN
jgi:hypothetical protein